MSPALFFLLLSWLLVAPVAAVVRNHTKPLARFVPCHCQPPIMAHGRKLWYVLRNNGASGYVPLPPDGLSVVDFRATAARQADYQPPADTLQVYGPYELSLFDPHAQALDKTELLQPWNSFRSNHNGKAFILISTLSERCPSRSPCLQRLLKIYSHGLPP